MKQSKRHMGQKVYSTESVDTINVDTAGKVGIGTASPGTRLDLGAGGYASQLSWHNDPTQSFGHIGLQQNSGAIGMLSGLRFGSAANSFESSTTITWGRSAVLLDYGNIKFFTNSPDTVAYGTTYTPTPRMTLDPSGNLLVGTTNSAFNSGSGFKMGVGSNPVLGVVGASSSNGDITYRLYSTGAAAYRFYVGMGGTISATSTTISGISDQRLKENVRELDDGLASVMALKPRKFDWKPGKGKDIKNDRGFIAQEFEQVFPDMIDTWQDPAPEGEEPYKAVNANLIPTLVKAIQELKTELDEAKAEIAALRKQP